ncbi:DEAD/DEAH box helicase, partial [Nonomuraea longicatena]|uniref:DEAD/DEAH box helicase n=1 Tax=Nonomuraea longicatena TaxID=83682 RepID=UPI0031CF9D4B
MIISTGTASGKSLAYLTPAVAACLDGGTVLYLTPTKALAADQRRSLRDLGIAAVRAACFDGDTPFEERTWIRQHANYVLTNPDMLHRALLPRHSQWSAFFRRLRVIVVDECHGYRGVFGSHVAQILRRLRRVCGRYGASPVFVLASATASEPGVFGRRLTGLEMDEVTLDGSPKGSTTFALWEPPLTDLRGEGGAPVRRTATAETADLLADLVLANVRTLAFVRSRRGAETVALTARAKLADVAASLASRLPRPTPAPASFPLHGHPAPAHTPDPRPSHTTDPARPTSAPTPNSAQATLTPNSAQATLTLASDPTQPPLAPTSDPAQTAHRPTPDTGSAIPAPASDATRPTPAQPVIAESVPPPAPEPAQAAPPDLARIASAQTVPTSEPTPAQT